MRWPPSATTSASISDVLVTHIHRDHYTQAVELRRLLGSRVDLGSGERRSLELLGETGTDRPSGSLHTLRRAGAHELAERVAAISHVASTERVEAPDRGWRTRNSASPTRGCGSSRRLGHTRGHVRPPRRGARAALLRAPRAAAHHPVHRLRTRPHRTAVGRLPRLAAPPDHPRRRPAPARPRPVVGPSVHMRVGELLDHHDDRLAQGLAVLGDRTLTAYTVAQELGWTRRQLPFADLGAFNQMLAVNETAAHLDVLVARLLGRAHGDRGRPAPPPPPRTS